MKKIILIILLIAVVYAFTEDTKRTRSELETIFADNTSGGISAQDIRDFLASVWVNADSVDFDKTLFDNVGKMFSYGGSGDIDGDGIISGNDAFDIVYYLGDVDTLTNSEFKEADVNGDGWVNFIDLSIVTQLVGKSIPVDDYLKLRAWHDAAVVEFNLTTYLSELYGSDFTDEDANKISVLTSYCDSITTSTDVIYLWKDGKRADIDFGVKVYRALILQVGTSAPTLGTLYENDLGGDLSFSRVTTGLYSVTLAGAFPENKTFIRASSTVLPLGLATSRTNDDSFTLIAKDYLNAGTDTGSMILEIIVYP